jgi:hypothetical protein
VAGRGTLASRDAGGRSLTPWLPLAWRFDAGAGAPRHRLGLFQQRQPLAHVELGPGGLSVSDLSLHARPARRCRRYLTRPPEPAGMAT